MRISEVVKETGLTKKAIRYYEGEGLINPNLDDNNNYRDYSLEEVNLLKEIAFFRKIDLPVDDIKIIIKDSNKRRIVLEGHILKLQQEVERLENSKAITSLVVNNLTHSGECDINVDKYSKLIDMKEKQKSGFINKELRRLFPGNFGKIISLHFSPYLNEPIDTEEKEKAWINIVKFLDDMEEIIVPKEFEEYLNVHMEEEEISSFDLSYTNSIDELISSPEKLKALINEYMESQDKGLLDIHHSLTKILRDQLIKENYYEVFIPNLITLSSSYKEYLDKLNQLQNLSKLKYDDNGRVRLE